MHTLSIAVVAIVAWTVFARSNTTCGGHNYIGHAYIGYNYTGRNGIQDSLVLGRRIQRVLGHARATGSGTASVQACVQTCVPARVPADRPSRRHANT